MICTLFFSFFRGFHTSFAVYNAQVYSYPFYSIDNPLVFTPNSLTKMPASSRQISGKSCLYFVLFGLMTPFSVANVTGSVQSKQTKSSVQPLTNADSNSTTARPTYGRFSSLFIFWNQIWCSSSSGCRFKPIQVIQNHCAACYWNGWSSSRFFFYLKNTFYIKQWLYRV